jgi:excisionase family DNA binding protein
MEDNDVTKRDYLSIAEAAERLGYSRQHVLRLVNSGDIRAERVGRSFVIKIGDLPGPLGKITGAEKQEIDKSVDKVLKHYSEAIRKLGKE